MSETKWGDVENVRFLTNVIAWDTEGKPVVCHCGNVAGMVIMGQDQHVAYCTDHWPHERIDAKFVVNDEGYKFSDAPKILKDDNHWTVNMKDDEDE